MRRASAKSFVKSYVEAWNQLDANAVVSHLRDDGYYLDAPRQQQLSGAALGQELEAYFLIEQHQYEVVGDVLCADSTIAFQYRATPQHPESNAAGWQGAEFITLAGRVAQSISDYYQLMTAGPSRPLASPMTRYAKSGLTDTAMAALLESLSELMATEKVYLDSDLSLPSLAERLGTSVNRLSQAINAGLGMTFFDYVNGFRIAAAMSMLQDTKQQAPAILDIALAVGFNSTSTFYTAFKKVHGQSPGTFRRTLVD